MNYAAAFYGVLDELIGAKDNGITQIDSTRPGLPAVFVHFYENFPTTGILTAVTLGVALGLHGDDGHAELAVSVRSSDQSWGLGAGFLAERARDQVVLARRSTLNMREPISTESAMSAYLITDAPSWAPSPIELQTKDGRRTVCILNAIPIFDSELGRVRTDGPHFLTCAAGFEPLDTRRKPRA